LRRTTPSTGSTRQRTTEPGGWQLGTEYDPHPPFEAGSPDKAGQFIEEEVLRVLGPRVANVRAALAGTSGYVEE